MEISVRSVAEDCYGLSGTFRVLSDIFGYDTPPRPLSVRQQLQLAQGEACRGINLILVGSEDFFDSDKAKIAGGVQFARDIFAQVGLGLRRVTRWWVISKAQAGGFTVIESEGEANDLLDSFFVDNNLLDIFFVKDITDDFVGKVQKIKGPCDKPHRRAGILCSLEGADAFFGNTVAHEIGHYLGLWHDGETSNFMGNRKGSSDSSTGVKTRQGEKMKKHCSVSRC